MTDWFTMAQTLGFPIAVCFWFMLRTEKVINNNTKALTEVKITVEKCKNNVT